MGALFSLLTNYLNILRIALIKPVSKPEITTSIDLLVAELRTAAKSIAPKIEQKLLRTMRTMEMPIVLGGSAHFFYHADRTHHAHHSGSMALSIVGDWNGWQHGKDKMERLHKDASIFYLKREFPIDARFAYRFQFEGEDSFNDPGNPFIEREVFGANTAVRMSAYALPAYAAEPAAEIPRGKIREFTITGGPKSEFHGRTVSVYIPAETTRLSKLAVLYVHDGMEMIEIGKFTTVLDNLFYAKPHLARCIVVFVPPVEREREYLMNARFARWFAHHVVPTVEARLKVSPKAHQRGTVGASLGGLLSAQLGLLFPNVFGKIIAQSPAFWVQSESIVKHFAKIRKLPLDWYIHTGRVHDALEGSLSMLNVLQDKGYTVVYRETNESHNWANWRGKFSELIEWFVTNEE
jgi:enterochelin esterase-like enzyme